MDTIEKKIELSGLHRLILFGSVGLIPLSMIAFGSNHLKLIGLVVLVPLVIGVLKKTYTSLSITKDDKVILEKRSKNEVIEIPVSSVSYVKFQVMDVLICTHDEVKYTIPYPKYVTKDELKSYLESKNIKVRRDIDYGGD